MNPEAKSNSNVLNRPIAANDQANPNWIGYRCIACAKFLPRFEVLRGCPDCQLNGSPANLKCEYDAIDGHLTQPSLPYVPLLTLGEGNTPLVKAPAALSSGQSCWFKMEMANPTGSHKDRMAALAVLDAKLRGKKRVLAASSGNAGVSIAAYAALHGLECEIAITADCPALYAQRIQGYKATLKVCADSLARWAYLEEQTLNPAVAVLTNFTLPAVGSPPVAIEGYKQIAFEVLNNLSTPLGSIYVPMARGDLLWGLYLGFEQLLKSRQISAMPRLVGVEPFARLSLVLQGASPHEIFPGKSLQSSVAGNTVTLQSVLAIRKTGGCVRVIDDRTAIAARHRLAAHGFYFELCAAAAWAAFEHDQQNASADKDDGFVSGPHHVVIATAGGINDAHLFTT